MQWRSVVARRLAPHWLRLLLAGLVLIAGGTIWATLQHGSSLDAALDAVPASTQRFSFTDWTAIRRAVGVGDAAAVTSEGDWIGRAYDRDLTSASTLTANADLLQQSLGFSPGNLDWEAVDQSSVGNSLVVRPANGVDLDAIATKLQSAGYNRPGDADGVWIGTSDKVSVNVPGLPLDTNYIALLRDQHLIVLSDQAASADAGVAAASGHAARLKGAAGISATASPVQGAAAIMLWAGDFACADLAMSKADADAQNAAAQAIAQAGGVSPVTGLAMGLTTSGSLTVAELFDSGAQADRNLNARAHLAVGPAIGRSAATFADDLRLTSGRRDGATVILRMKAAHDGVFPLSSVYSGPVIFASC